MCENSNNKVHFVMPKPIFVKSVDSQANGGVHFIPEENFQMMVIGNISAGKTTLLINLLKSANGFYSRFNRIIWNSPTASLDAKIKKELCSKNASGLVVPNKPLMKEIVKRERVAKKSMLLGKIKACFIGTPNGINQRDYTSKPIESPDELINDKLKIIEDSKPRCLIPKDFVEDTSFSFFNDILEHQSNVIKEYGKDLADNVLIILDDLAGNKRNFEKVEVLNSVVKSRHYKITTVFVTQAYYQIPKTIRLNCGVKVIFNITNEKELSSVYEENTCELSSRDFVQKFQDIHKLMYRFVVVNHYNPRGYKLIDSFESFVN